MEDIGGVRASDWLSALNTVILVATGKGHANTVLTQAKSEDFHWKGPRVLSEDTYDGNGCPCWPALGISIAIRHLAGPLPPLIDLFLFQKNARLTPLSFRTSFNVHLSNPHDIIGNSSVHNGRNIEHHWRSCPLRGSRRIPLRDSELQKLSRPTCPRHT